MGHEPHHFRCPLQRRHHREIHRSVLFSCPSLSGANQFPGVGAGGINFVFACFPRTHIHMEETGEKFAPTNI